MFSEHLGDFPVGLESVGVDSCACVDEDLLIWSVRAEMLSASYRPVPSIQALQDTRQEQNRTEPTCERKYNSTHNTHNQPSRDRKDDDDDEVVAHVISGRCEELQAASPLPKAANPTEAGSMCQQRPSGRATSFHRHFHMQALGCMSVLSFFLVL